MGGGLMQLVAYGAQDIYLTGNPQITFFKVVYRRHTNFSMETIEQTINGATAVAPSSGTGTVTISRNGDLVNKIYVTSSASGVTDGDSIVNEVELEIGGQRIDRHFKEWHQIWNELTTDESKAVGLKSMKGCVGSSGTTGVGMVQVPLQFWFCRNPGLALPLIALQYHEVKLKITWGVSGDVGTTADCKVVADYIYLDTDERRRFAQVSHEYLIEQLQKQTSGGSTSEKLNFNHPVKELIWTNQAAADYDTAQLKLNGHDRFSAQESEYFQLRQPFDYHTAVPRQNLPNGSNNSLLHDRGATATPLVASAGSSTQAFAGTGAEAVGSVPENEFFFTASNNTLSIHSTNLVLNEATDLGVGDQLLLQITITSASGTQPTAGIYIATIKTVVSKTQDIQVESNIVFSGPPTLLSDNTTALINTGANAAAAGTQLVILGRLAFSSAQARTSQLTNKINVYSFGLKPEEHQPSGTCNFSRIDTAKLDFTGTQPNSSQNIYAVNYNVLRIMSGMGGLAYSN